MIKLSKRLEAISSLIPNNSKIIDVGCDHGLLDIYLYQKKNHYLSLSARKFIEYNIKQ